MVSEEGCQEEFSNILVLHYSLPSGFLKEGGGCGIWS